MHVATTNLMYYSWQNWDLYGVSGYLNNLENHLAKSLSSI